MGEKGKITPMLKQYWSVKKQYPDAILFFRMGDFYEMFFDDAKLASRELGLTLTSRNKQDNIPLCGVPHHSVDIYLAKLLKKGYKIAVCDQVEDPRFAKGIVKREVVRVLTPGVNLEEGELLGKTENYLVALIPLKKGFSFGILEFSTGDFEVAFLKNDDELKEELSRINPSEIVFPLSREDDIRHLLKNIEIKPFLSPLRDYYFEGESESEIKEFYGVISLESFGIADDNLLPAVIGILRYVKETQKGVTRHLKHPSLYRRDNFLFIDESTKKNLEIFENIREGGESDTLFSVINRTVTPMGRRLLARWVSFPLLNPGEIKHRQMLIESFLEDPLLRESLREYLNRVYDLERLISKVMVGSATPKDMGRVRDSLSQVKIIKEILDESFSEFIKKLNMDLPSVDEIYEKLDSALVDNPPIQSKEGGIIRDGYDKELDELREIKDHSEDILRKIESREKEKTGIPNLKIGFNKVFGYYIEVSKSYLSQVPHDYIRKQTLVGGERFITGELKDLEEKILTAEGKAVDLEYELFSNLRRDIEEKGKVIQKVAQQLAFIDVIASLAVLAEERSYVKPEIVEDPVLEIIDGRHPVVEVVNREEPFVPNSLFMDAGKNQIIILTGPNMAGKSTYLRQNALIILLAQMGSFVPATKAKIGIVDRLYSRVGASDSLARGLSTFMVEMVETANILHNATNRSFIILDEIGRGTSTFDGISIAWATVEYLHERIGARTLFATHYHELIELEELKDRVENYSMEIKEHRGEIIFLRKVKKGGSSHSYGIEVARLAGLPGEVILRAREILKQLEKEEYTSRRFELPEEKPVQLSLFKDPVENAGEELLRFLQKKDMDRLKPLDALNLLYHWKEKFLGKK